MAEKIIPPIVGYIDNSINCLKKDANGQGIPVDFSRKWKNKSYLPPGYTQIGDVELIVPPQSITVESQSQNSNVRTLRSKGSVIIKSGFSDITITMQLYFHNNDAINGTRVVGIDGSDWYINGLRPLIAQFKKSPFLPILNEDLNDLHNIEAVTLRNITAQTVPGFPDCIVVTLTMLKFNYETYMPYTANFYRSFNWKLFRWYYQKAMDVENKEQLNKIYLHPYGSSSNIFSYSVIQEDSLQLVQNMIKELKTQQLPSEYNAVLRNKNSLSGQQYADGEKMKLGQLQQWRVKQYLLDDSPERMDGIEYDGNFGDEEAIWDRTLECYVMEITNPGTWAMAKRAWDAAGQVAYTSAPWPKEYGDYKVWCIPPSSATAEEIMRQYDGVLRDMQKYKAGYNDKQQTITDAENNVRFINKTIPDLYVTSISVALDNIVSSFQVQQQESSSHQYMGSGDTYVEMRMQATTTDAVGRLVNMVKYCERITRDYRIGMVAGFMNVENDLIKLFGVRSLVVNNLTVDTVPGQPDLYDISMTLIGFNRNQRDTEKIEIINDSSSYTSVHEVRREAGEENLQVEEKLLDFELYPDLELPTLEELGNFCNQYNITYPYGTTPYCKYTGLQIPRGKYADPDFYVYAPTTLRNTINDQIEYAAKHPAEAGLKIHDSYTKDNPLSVIFPGDNDTLNSWSPYYMEQSAFNAQSNIQTDVNNARKKARVLDTNESTKSGHNETTIQDVTNLGANQAANLQNNANFKAMEAQQAADPGSLSAKKPFANPFNEQNVDAYMQQSSIVGERLGGNKAQELLKVEEAQRQNKYSNRGSATPEFIIDVGNAALALHKVYGNAIWPSVMIAQAIEESGWGTVRAGSYNYFGMKDTSGGYRTYSSFDEGMQGYAEFLTNEDKAGYYKYVPYSTSAAHAVRNIAAKWNPNPGYVDTILTHINEQNLLEWDKLADIGVAGVMPIHTPTLDKIDQANANIKQAMDPYNAKINVGKLWKDSCQDMMETDMRGRLVRAFPTFQMLLIDEGKWISWVKMWDNFYGFNSLQSIDVVKSRKIAADTCLISMTNIYQNLTDMDINSDANNIYSQEYELHDFLFKSYDHKSLIEARQERQTQLMLQTGARLHLRMGYGSNAYALPIVFNGTITEIELGDGTIDLVAQGDGIELCNAISADPKEVSDGDYNKEPRDTLCYLLSKHDNLLDRIINNTMSNPEREPSWIDNIINPSVNPLGIMHFGNPAEFPKSIEISFFWEDTENLGDCGINIYTSAGTGSKSEWIYSEDGFSEYSGISGAEPGSGIGYKKLWGVLPWPKGDEADVLVSLYNKSTWDVAKTLALVAPDYISTVLPFEFRSTLFYGKPYWPYYYRYIYKYTYHEDTGLVEKDSAYKIPLGKPMQQNHLYMSFSDIIMNKIKASEEGVRTNVIATFGEGEMSATMCADSDIYPSKQKTAIVNIDMKPPSDKIKDVIAAQLLRDFMKDMYKGNLVVVGDPSVKPYDNMFIHDVPNEMYGMTGVKQVVLHMNMDTGFTTDITPDAIVIVDDTLYTTHVNMAAAILAGSAGYEVGRLMMNKTIKTFMKIPFVANGKNFATEAFASYNDFVKNPTKLKNFATLEDIANGPLSKQYAYKLANLQRLGTIINEGGSVGEAAALATEAREGKAAVGVARSLATATKAANAARNTRIAMFGGRLLGTFGSWGPQIIGTAALTYIANSALDAYARFRKSRQAVLIIPISYKGLPLTAGINGHQGCVMGDKPSKYDDFWNGQSDGISGFIISTLNALSMEE